MPQLTSSKATLSFTNKFAFLEPNENDQFRHAITWPKSIFFFVWFVLGGHRCEQQKKETKMFRELPIVLVIHNQYQICTNGNIYFFLDLWHYFRMFKGAPKWQIKTLDQLQYKNIMWQKTKQTWSNRCTYNFFNISWWESDLLTWFRQIISMCLELQ